MINKISLVWRYNLCSLNESLIIIGINHYYPILHNINYRNFQYTQKERLMATADLSLSTL